MAVSDMDGTCGTSECRICGQDRALELPRAIVDDCHAGRLVLFVGAGASTEGHNVGNTFYSTIQSDLGLDPGDQTSFPDLMSAFVERFSRNELITRFLKHLHYIQSFPVLYNRASEFHRRLSINPFLNTIITTNWDDYFEKVTGAIPLVTGPDFAYWDAPVRKVLKIHGSILNPGSIVATRQEYDRSLQELRNGALGSTAKHLISTSTVVFIGYSYRDDDIREVIDVLRSDLSSAARKCYFVHPDPGFEPPIAGAELLATSARMFIKLLDDALIDEGALLSRRLFDRVDQLRDRESAARRRCYSLEVVDYPLEIYDLAYRDGIRDYLGRFEATAEIGHDRVHTTIPRRAAHYENWLDAAMKARDYWNAAYIEGYLMGMYGLVSDVRIGDLPFYYCPGAGPLSSFREAARLIKAGPATHKTAYRWAERRVANYPRGMVPSHSPFLPRYDGQR